MDGFGSEAHVELLKTMTRATGRQMEDLNGLRQFARQCGSPALLTATLDRVFDYTKYQLEYLTKELSSIPKDLKGASEGDRPAS